MREDSKARLNALMAGYEVQRTELQKQLGGRDRWDAFIAEFEQVARDVIRPVMEDIGTALRQRGHDYKIATTRGHPDAGGQLRENQITMRIFPGEIPKSLFTFTSTPHVTFAGDVHQMRISIYENTTSPFKGGRYGQKAVVFAGQLTPDLVEREILEVLAGVFSG